MTGKYNYYNYHRINELATLIRGLATDLSQR